MEVDSKIDRLAGSHLLKIEVFLLARVQLVVLDFGEHQFFLEASTMNLLRS